MKKFFRNVGASFVGSLLTLIVVIFLLFGIVGSLSKVSDTKPTVPKSAILVIDGSLSIAEQNKENPLASINPVVKKSAKDMGIYNVIRSIEHATEDPAIKFIYLDLSTFAAEASYVEELRVALEQFRNSGKAIVAYGDSYSQPSYYLATIADKIYLNPTGAVPLRGVSITTLFLKDLLDNIGIEMELIRHGKFKAAGEQFISDRMSKENREQISAYINSVWDIWVEEISQSREIEREEIERISNNLLSSNADAALRFKLVDSLLSRDEMEDRLIDLFGVEKRSELKKISIEDYSKATTKINLKVKDKVAILYADGDIVMGSSNKSIGCDSFTKEIRKVEKDSSIKAVVLRINSPGGSAVSSDIIERELTILKEKKPLVVSMGEYAASGGYWIAAKGDKIVANRSTLTGSIGVFSMIPNVHQGITKHLKVKSESVNTNDHSDMLSGFRSLKPAEEEFLRQGVEDFYTQFINLVAEGRSMEFEQVDEIAQGRIWSGTDALEIGLIDKIGGLNEALLTAAQLANLENYRVVEYPTVKTTVEMVMEQLGQSSSQLIELPTPLQQLKEHYLELFKTGKVVEMARVPFYPLLHF